MRAAQRLLAALSLLFLVSGPVFAQGMDGSTYPMMEDALALLQLVEEGDAGMECCDKPVTQAPCKGTCVLSSLCISKVSLALASVEPERATVLLAKFGGTRPRAQGPWSEPPPSEPPRI